MKLKAIEWHNNKVKFIDQTKLPEKLEFVETDNYLVIEEAIKNLRIRGAPAIGIAGAFGVVLAIRQYSGSDKKEFLKFFIEKIINTFRNTRPTAKNLFWALDRIKKSVYENRELSIENIKEIVLKEALDIYKEDENISKKIGENGAKILKDSSTVLTHCNTGFLVTAGIGTALGIIYTAVEQGKKIKVFADETRPLLQGARLTVWELMNRGIDVTLICDNMAAFVMKKGLVDYVLVGADRIATNGDTANKIGTYNLAVLCEKHKIPFFVAAPYSTFDFDIKNGDDIKIEERKPEEVKCSYGRYIAPRKAKVFNPAFDITPNNLITGFITEVGIFYPPYGNWENLKKP
ncbi:S-methyl-5-thioribose-1-phosphate isomerase [candidate division KSB1 bacterium]|nr:MAG: S-methyl-5-thioribose-1-phosphate isomerase [candidate division KSB1 bacterium]